MIRPLVIDEKLKAQAAKVVDYASKHYYIPGESAAPPGDDPRYTLLTEFGYRCVFSFTAVKGVIYRDLSVSVRTPGKFPNEFALYTIATELFGFTGWDGKSRNPPQDWMLDKDIYFDAIRVVQLKE